MTEDTAKTTAALEALLQEWLPKQRWFASKDRTAQSSRLVSHRELVGAEPTATEDAGVSPGMWHLLVDVDGVLYQVFVGLRAELPQHLEYSAIGYVDGVGSFYDALHDRQLTHLIIDWMSSGTERASISFRHTAGVGIPTDAPSLVLTGEQSNTSVVFGEQSILKVFRMVVPGTNPDLEVNRALTAAGNSHVAAVQGWIEMELTDQTTTLGLLQAFLRNGSDGWSLALTSVRDLFAEGDLHASEVGGDFAAESERLGMATADVHLALADAMPTAIADHDSCARLASAMRARLDAATSATTALQARVSEIGEVFDRLGHLHEPARLQRVHGDFHLGQVLRTEAGWTLLDFEGEPGAQIHERTTLSSPLRDVAGMLRSIDYASRFLLADHPGAAQLEYRAVEWADRNRDAFCVGYAKVAGRDPRDDLVLLRAFELDRAVYEVVYEATNRPDWVHIPLHSIERLLAA